ncbi:DUF2726 domain-containing protein [Lyngbya sp. CCY1209]|uniref:DUF2726 domain-containing protein n=1 Tax=Lyngbya sp. CCY1209 TaxID=2886103 RepID=UPI002D2111DE|nr:DUF2726 domain-containing protein [Lyngbya sp. CCY1209]MEB3882306.1 DUF2726 domain-containing protein [Lyngbya sp. CCY1209]
MTSLFNSPNSDRSHSDNLENWNAIAPHFTSGNVMNDNERMTLEILKTILGSDRYQFCPQLPLSVVCDRTDPGWLPNEIWKFWVSSRLDFTLLEWGFCASSKAKLVVECQSPFHDLPDVMERDRKKAELLAVVGVPLIYTRSVDEDRRFIRFFTPHGDTEIFYNSINRDGRQQLEDWLGGYL